MLSQSDVIPYLLDHHLLTAETIVDGHVAVRDASSRNRNFRVECGGAPSYFLKQAVHPEAQATVAHEADIYHLLAEDGALAPYLPRFFGYDPMEGVLILELVRGSRNLRDHHARTGRFSTALASHTGRALALLHRSNSRSEQRTARECAPWVTMLHRPDLEIFRQASAAALSLIRIVQRTPYFGERLDDVSSAYTVSTLVHYDLKWDNLLAYSPAGSSQKKRLMIVDWEISQAGDPCWDVGSAFGSYLSTWLFSIPVTGDHPPEQFAEVARYPLRGMHRAIRAFWHGYTSEIELETAGLRRQLVRAVELTAVRLLQTAFEAAQMSTELSSSLILHLQLSHNILQRPEEAVVHLLGLSLRDAVR